MSKFKGRLDIVSTGFHIILLNFVATEVYALFMKSIKRNLLRNVQNEKTADLEDEGTPKL